MTDSFELHPNGSPMSSRLTGWKEIAAHFGKGVRTVQRWEKDLVLRVHRRDGTAFARATGLETPR